MPRLNSAPHPRKPKKSSDKRQQAKRDASFAFESLESREVPAVSVELLTPPPAVDLQSHTAIAPVAHGANAASATTSQSGDSVSAAPASIAGELRVPGPIQLISLSSASPRSGPQMPVGAPAVPMPSVIDSIGKTFEAAGRMIDIGPKDDFAKLGLMKVDSLKPGDIILSTTGDFLSGGIRMATWSAYSHAALYVGNGQVIHAVGKGVVRVKLAELASDATRLSVLRHKDVSDAHAKRIVDAASRMVGKPYDKWALVDGAVDKLMRVIRWIPGVGSGAGLTVAMRDRINAKAPEPKDLRKAYVCTQVVRDAYFKAGIKLPLKQMAEPQHFVDNADKANLMKMGRLPTPKMNPAPQSVGMPAVVYA